MIKVPAFLFIILAVFSLFIISPGSEEINIQKIVELTKNKDTLWKADKLTEEIGDLKYRQLKGALYPQLKLEHFTVKRGGDYDFKPQVEYMNYEIPIDINIFRTYETKLTVTQLLWDNNRINYAMKIQDYEKKDIRVMQYRKNLDNELIENLKLYLALIASIKKQKLLEEYKIFIEKSINVSREQLENGLITEIDYKLIGFKQRENEINIKEEQLNQETLKRSLSEKLRVESVDVTDYDLVIPTLSDSEDYYFHKMNWTCPDINIQNTRIRQSEYNIKRMKSEKGPYVTLYYTAGLRSDELLSTENGWIFGFNVTQDIFTGSIKKNRITQAEKELEIQQVIYEEIREKYKLLLMEKYRSAEDAYNKVQLKKELISILEEKVKIEENKLEMGKISQLQFLETTLEYTTARIEAELLTIDYLKNYYELLYVCGNIEQWIKEGYFI